MGEAYVEHRAGSEGAMTDFVNYDQILDDLVTMLRANVTAPNAQGLTIDRDQDDTDFVWGNFPLVDVRAARALPDLTGGQQYYTAFVVEIEVVAGDLSSRQDAVRLRNGLLNQVHRAVQTNPRFGASNDSCIIGQVEFETEQSPENGAYIAAAVAQISVMIYTQ
jgi:hypothetical protein